MRKSLITLVAALSGVLMFLGVAGAHHGGHGPEPTATGSGIPTADPTPSPIPTATPILGFSDGNFHGTYIYYFQGTQDGVGVLTADGNGNIISGSETVSDGTNVCNGSLSGTYSVNLDGTGTLTLSFTTTEQVAGSCPAAAVDHSLALVMTSDRYLNTAEEDPGQLVRGHLTKQHRDDAIGE